MADYKPTTLLQPQLRRIGIDMGRLFGANPNYALIPQSKPQIRIKDTPEVTSSFYLGRIPGSGKDYSIMGQSTGYFIDVHRRGVEVTPFDEPANLTDELRNRVIREFTLQLRTTREGHELMSRLTDQQIFELNIETLLEAELSQRN